MADFLWENSKISQNAMALTAIAPKQWGEIIEISCLTIHRTPFFVYGAGPMAKFPKML